LGWAGLNPAQHIYWWLGWAQPHRGWARPSQPGLVTGPSQWPAGQTDDARVKHVHACINSAKVIKLPSHCSNAIWTQKSKNQGKRAHLFLEIAKKVATLVGFDCFPFLAMVKKASTPGWVHCFLLITDGSVINCFLAGTKTRLIRDSPLPFSPFLCIYFLVYALFFLVFYSVLGWCFRSSLCIFLGCVLCALLFLGWLLCFFGPPSVLVLSIVGYL